MAAQRGSRKARRFSSAGSRYANPVWAAAPIGVGGSECTPNQEPSLNTPLSRQHRAAIIPLPTAATRPVANHPAVVSMSLEQARRIVAIDDARAKEELRVRKLAEAARLEIEAGTLLRRANTIRSCFGPLEASHV